MKLGILGGTFDPPHLGHLAIAKAAMESLELDAVLFVPNNRNPHKEEKAVVSARKRLRLVESMIADDDGFMASDIEITRGGPSYMYDTLNELQGAQPGMEFWLIMGADALAGFMNWHYSDRILKMARLAVAVRPGVDLERLTELQAEPVQRKIDFIEMEPMSISATQIRQNIAEGVDCSSMLHPDVYAYIQENGLYQS
jgi:nicotinate-nucleotide adenylyltransferase